MSMIQKSHSKFNLQEITFLLLLIGFSTLFCFLIFPFLIIFIFSSIFVYILTPLYDYLVFKKSYPKSASALVLLFLSIFILSVPTLFLSFSVYQELQSYLNTDVNFYLNLFDEFHTNIYRKINEISWIPQDILSRFAPNDSFKIKDQLKIFFQNLFSSTTLYTSTITTTLTSITGIGVFLFDIILFFYFTYYLLIDGKKLKEKIFNLLPIENNSEEKLFISFFRMAKATLLGTILIGIIEGIYATILFIIADLPSPFLLGLCATILSMIPILGVNGIFILICIYYLIIGEIFWFIFFLIAGCGVILISQNLIKPKLVGNQAGVHPVIVIVAMLGGITWIGISGFIIGPLLSALFIDIWEQFGKRYKDSLIFWNKEKDSS